MGASEKGFKARLIQYQVEFKPSARKSLAGLPKKIQRRIQGVVETLETNPLPPVAKKLTGRGAYRIRVSDYRIIYTIHRNVLTVVVVAIGHRKEIYK
jgi:mRNA interferase RelE/StbE